MATTDRLLAGRFQLAVLRAFSRRHTLLVRCALFLVVALLVRLYRLGAQSLWLDEGGTWAEVTGKPWSALLAELWGRNAAYPLYHVLLKAWVGVAGDSEWALRCPSALAGAGAVVAIYLAATEGEPRPGDDGRQTQFPLIAALLVAISPFALWYAQDAKVYSLLILIVALELWALVRALRRNDGRSWLLVLVMAIVSIFVHRLALLVGAGSALAYLLVWPPGRMTNDDGRRTTADRQTAQHVSRIAFALLTAVLAGAGVAGIAIGFSGESRGTGGHIPAGPIQGLWLSLAHFSADRGDVAGFLGLPLLIWMLPCLVLTLWGLALLLRAALRRSPPAIAILCLFAVPLALLAAALALTPIYEARYATIAFPAWALVIAYPFAGRPTTGERYASHLTLHVSDRSVLGRPPAERFSALRGALFFVLCSLFLVNAIVLVQPLHGLFSGAPVKEQWRAAIDELAHQAHPDDLLILHPYFVQPLWDYYAPRVTPDPLPQPVTFPVFAGGYCAETYKNPSEERECIKRRYNEPYFNRQAFGKKRALLLIAPDHANIVDPPINPSRDTYGWVGLRFQHASEERAWPCGGSGDRYIGVELMCMSFPETYNAAGSGHAPQPAVQLDAIFGGQLRLRGYSIDLLGGAARPGGTLPITLYWQAAAPPSHDYTMFLHLCRDCTAAPLAQDDRPPLQGYPPAGHTTTWRLGDPVHDERAVTLPANLPPGRYTLLLGVYPAGDPAERARLPVASAAEVLGGTRLVLGEVFVK
jgi:hypothetical protein